MLIELVDLHTCFCSVEKEFNVQTHVIPIDFSSQDVYPKISSAIDGLEIGILGKFIYYLWVSNQIQEGNNRFVMLLDVHSHIHVQNILILFNSSLTINLSFDTMRQ